MNFDNLRSMLRRHEGVRDKPYRCSAGKLTIGVGHNLDDLGLPVHIIDELFEYDLQNTIADCASLYPNWNELPEEIQAVLIDMCFNMGKGRLQKFKKMNRAVEDFNWVRMIEEMRDSLWYKQVKNRAVELEEIVRSVT